ncbi:aminotransferase class III-fold pyridoxal phosphate-dependent enzyme (plasmid) [Deinococcus taeanensis]|uniref:aminotransferase class III-fold pyridoxal phosphate-dependent enzyme n=1 Tax=Deinococcus taeanensis TaxID=2737050 RepID=UPI001CDC5D32|nr:aminotransferase class III-fold pyridoxal phosphate-dependent enzyme [Deinococcus taeanensis]UBV44486.1 aminotransferase class III-fold pyridoxal phosphate-dependent enzyme [Deinococcus taeanensis]
MPTPRPQPECSAPTPPPFPACASHPALRSLLPRALTHVSVYPTVAAATRAALHHARRSTGRRELISTVPADGLSATAPDGNLRHLAYGDLHALEAAAGPEVAAVMIEPFCGERGLAPGSEAFMRAARAFCRRSGAQLIIDERHTGFGQTGRVLALDHAAVAPDLLLLAPTGPAGPGLLVSGKAAGSPPPDEPAAQAVLQGLNTLRRYQRSWTGPGGFSAGAALARQLRALPHGAWGRVQHMGSLVSAELPDPHHGAGRRSIPPALAALTAAGIHTTRCGRALRFHLPPGTDVLNEVLPALRHAGGAS